MGMLAVLLLYSCANIGRPEGGPRDMDPPIFIASDPKPNSLNIKSNKIELTFDEIVTLDDQQNKVVVSPVQKESARISASGRKITIEFRDTLLENTTYSIDFADAIQDNNEGNPLEDFSFAFSTGDSIDTLCVSGIVLRARDLEPMQKVLVGIHSNLEDSAVRTLKFDRIARTNSLGQFTIRNLKPGTYHVFALDDTDRDYKFVRTENFAFLDEFIVPTAHTITTMDTIFTKKNLVDTVFEAQHTEFLPNDLLLSMFNEGYQSQYLKTYERPEDNKIFIKFATQADSLPQIEIIKPRPSRPDWFAMERSEKYDSLMYWLKDSTLIMSDSITLAMTYLRTDTLEQLSPTTDTLNLVLRGTYRKLKEKQREDDAKKERDRVDKIKQEWQDLSQEREKAQNHIDKEREEFLKHNPDATPDSPDFPVADDMSRFARLDTMLNDTMPIPKTLNFTITTSGNLDVYSPILFKTPTPLDTIIQSAFTLQIYNDEDSAWVVVDHEPVKRQYEWNPLILTMQHQWEPGGKYQLKVDTCAVRSIYGLWSSPMSASINIKGLEEYANLFIKVSPITNGAFIELLDGSDRILQTAPLIGGQAEFLNVNPGEYYARLVVDSNHNGIWDTGNYDDHLQPEEVYYFHKTLKLKKNWDVEQNWDIYELPVDKQKPDKVKKNKPDEKKNWDEEETNGKKKKKSSSTSADEEDEYDADWVPTIYTGNKYTDYSE